MACQAATHEIHIDAGRGVVIKRFRSWDRREPAREWTALMLLAEYAPGLAATPVRGDLTADPPVVEMSRLPGVPLGGTTPSAAQVDALALALDRLWNAVPRARLTDLDAPGLNASQLARRVDGMLAAHQTMEDHALVRRAWLAGADWFFGATLDTLNSGDVVLGQGDANLANFLWDGTQIRIVDFEDSGPSDRAFELAVLVEHISAWSDAGLPAEVFLALFDLTAAEQAKMREYRRLSALFWLMMLLPGSPAHRRNPPGTLERQAARLLLLLDCDG
jgi:Ser/Thr protein kinase RdoA (MazF antagonist)